MAKTSDPDLFQKKSEGRIDSEANSKVLKYTDDKMVEVFSAKFGKLMNADELK